MATINKLFPSRIQTTVAIDKRMDSRMEIGREVSTTITSRTSTSSKVDISFPSSTELVREVSLTMRSSATVSREVQSISFEVTPEDPNP